MPAFAWVGAPQCDADGNIFWHSGYRLQDVTFLEILNDGSHVIYHPSSPDDSSLIFVQFYVSAAGELFILATNETEDLFLLKAGDDPSNFSRTKLDVQGGAGPYTVKSFVALPNGTLVLYGYFDDKAPKAERGHAYVIELDASGRVLRNLSEAMPDSELKSFIDRGGAAPVVGRDGLTYFLAPDEVLAVSQAGEVSRRIELHPPAPGFDAWQLNTAGGRLLVNFMKVPKDGTFMLPLYLLLDGSTGEQLRLYRPSNELGNVLACFSDEGLTFYRVNKQGYVELVTVPAR